MVNEEANSEEKETLLQTISEDDRIDDYLNVYQSSVDVVSGDVKKSIYLFVPQSQEDLKRFVTFRDRRTKETYTLNDEGIILTEQMAGFLDVDAGTR